MPEQETIEAAQRDLAEGKSASTAAGEFVRQEIDHVREGKHGVKNAKQAIAIGLSEARRAGVDIPDNPNRASKTGKRAKNGKRAKTAKRGAKTSAKRARAAKKALKRQPSRGATKKALSKQAKASARKRGAAARSASAKKAARTRAKTTGRKSTARKSTAQKHRPQKHCSQIIREGGKAVASLIRCP